MMVVLRFFDYDSIDKNEIKFGFYMALHHPLDSRGKFAFGMIKYSLRIIMRKLCCFGERKKGKCRVELDLHGRTEMMK